MHIAACFDSNESTSGYLLNHILDTSSTVHILGSPKKCIFNPLNAELNPICYLLAFLGAHHFLHVSRIRVKSVIYIYIYGAPILDVSRSHTTTHHSR